MHCRLLQARRSRRGSLCRKPCICERRMSACSTRCWAFCFCLEFVALLGLAYDHAVVVGRNGRADRLDRRRARIRREIRNCSALGFASAIPSLRSALTSFGGYAAVTGFMPGISSSITPDAANVITGRAAIQAAQIIAIIVFLLFIMFSISVVFNHKNVIAAANPQEK